ncbi:MAG: hypothetical protein PHP59_06265 [Methanofollis sp.]|uniref:hypothetical protein n=1 Tax=Methanofollis sp. TaxID=2052835 RepID=UPI0026151521|nr:hypothetical protein [Methanofollis sp.]MDD4254967.1 hypothetical protein [Methanofollis sp.]
MRLPRSGSPGTSLAMPLRAVIADCRKKGFTGAVTFMVHGSPASLLFRCGMPLCAESGRATGIRALEEMERVSDVVTAELSGYSEVEIGAALLFNDACRVTTGPRDASPATTIHAVRVGQKSRSATVKMVRTVEAGDDRPATPPLPKTGETKDVLNPESVTALKKMQQNFMADASDLLKEMHMGHLIVDPEKSPDQ